MGRKNQRAQRTPAEQADFDLAAGRITQWTKEKRRAAVFRRECTEVWGEDVWHGHDRNYPAEQLERQRKHRQPRKKYTGSGGGKIECAKCRRLTPPNNMVSGRCEDCALHGASEFYLRSLGGSSNSRQMMGDGT